MGQVVPMVNPEGVVMGNYRCGLSGVDLNRRWRRPDPACHPPIHDLKVPHPPPPAAAS